MALRPLSEVKYIPMLSVRPAEMQALEELPDRDKDIMLPAFSLRPWTSALSLDSALARLEAAYGDRACFVNISDAEDVENRRPVHDELDLLRDANDGYQAWCSFVEERPNFIPSVQYGNLNELDIEVERLYSLGRGLLVPIKQALFGFAPGLAQRIADITDGGEDVCFLLDYERATVDLLTRQMLAVGLLSSIKERAPDSYLAISGSSFPDSFADITHQEIYERRFFDGISENLEFDELIYSDRGSARAERIVGGGGAIPPRIDYAQFTQWTFFRSEDSSPKRRREEYRRQAHRATTDASWDSQLRLWGTQMIERTALGDAAAITSQAKAAAVRINIHLHLQTYYDDPDGVYETDEEWKD